MAAVSSLPATEVDDRASDGSVASDIIVVPAPQDDDACCGQLPPAPCPENPICPWGTPVVVGAVPLSPRCPQELQEPKGVWPQTINFHIPDGTKSKSPNSPRSADEQVEKDAKIAVEEIRKNLHDYSAHNVMKPLPISPRVMSPRSPYIDSAPRGLTAAQIARQQQVAREAQAAVAASSPGRIVGTPGIAIVGTPGGSTGTVQTGTTGNVQTKTRRITAEEYAELVAQAPYAVSPVSGPQPELNVSGLLGAPKLKSFGLYPMPTLGYSPSARYQVQTKTDAEGTTSVSHTGLGSSSATTSHTGAVNGGTPRVMGDSPIVQNDVAQPVDVPLAAPGTRSRSPTPCSPREFAENALRAIGSNTSFQRFQLKMSTRASTMATLNISKMPGLHLRMLSPLNLPNAKNNLNVAEPPGPTKIITSTRHIRSTPEMEQLHPSQFHTPVQYSPIPASPGIRAQYSLVPGSPGIQLHHQETRNDRSLSREGSSLSRKGPSPIMEVGPGSPSQAIPGSPRSLQAERFDSPGSVSPRVQEATRDPASNAEFMIPGIGRTEVSERDTKEHPDADMQSACDNTFTFLSPIDSPKAEAKVSKDKVISPQASQRRQSTTSNLSQRQQSMRRKSQGSKELKTAKLAGESSGKSMSVGKSADMRSAWNSARIEPKPVSKAAFPSIDSEASLGGDAKVPKPRKTFARRFVSASGMAKPKAKNDYLTDLQFAALFGPKAPEEPGSSKEDQKPKMPTGTADGKAARDGRRKEATTDNRFITQLIADQPKAKAKSAAKDPSSDTSGIANTGIGPSDSEFFSAIDPPPPPLPDEPIPRVSLTAGDAKDRDDARSNLLEHLEMTESQIGLHIDGLTGTQAEFEQHVTAIKKYARTKAEPMLQDARQEALKMQATLEKAANKVLELQAECKKLEHHKKHLIHKQKKWFLLLSHFEQKLIEMEKQFDDFGDVDQELIRAHETLDRRNRFVEMQLKELMEQIGNQALSSSSSTEEETAKNTAANTKGGTPKTSPKKDRPSSAGPRVSSKGSSVFTEKSVKSAIEEILIKAQKISMDNSQYVKSTNQQAKTVSAKSTTSSINPRTGFPMTRNPHAKVAGWKGPSSGAVQGASPRASKRGTVTGLKINTFGGDSLSPSATTRKSFVNNKAGVTLFGSSASSAGGPGSPNSLATPKQSAVTRVAGEGRRSKKLNTGNIAGSGRIVPTSELLMPPENVGIEHKDRLLQNAGTISSRLTVRMPSGDTPVAAENSQGSIGSAATALSVKKVGSTKSNRGLIPLNRASTTSSGLSRGDKRSAPLIDKTIDKSITPGDSFNNDLDDNTESLDITTFMKQKREAGEAGNIYDKKEEKGAQTLSTGLSAIDKQTIEKHASQTKWSSAAIPNALTGKKSTTNEPTSSQMVSMPKTETTLKSPAAQRKNGNNEVVKTQSNIMKTQSNVTAQRSVRIAEGSHNATTNNGESGINSTEHASGNDNMEDTFVSVINNMDDASFLDNSDDVLLDEITRLTQQLNQERAKLLALQSSADTTGAMAAAKSHNATMTPSASSASSKDTSGPRNDISVPAKEISAFSNMDAPKTDAVNNGQSRFESVNFSPPVTWATKTGVDTKTGADINGNTGADGGKTSRAGGHSVEQMGVDPSNANEVTTNVTEGPAKTLSPTDREVLKETLPPNHREPVAWMCEDVSLASLFERDPISSSDENNSYRDWGFQEWVDKLT